MNLTNSLSLYNRAKEIIPTGTQTFSKGRFCYPSGVPLYIERGKGSHVWDVDGNEYIDFVGALCPVILGYCDEDVDNAVKEQIDKGVIFSLPSPLEIEVAELFQKIIPCAEMTRYGKNGSDATSGAVRVARAYTGRDYIITFRGHYHGWQDWYIGITPRNTGVPSAIRSLTLQAEYNHIDSLHRIFAQYPSQIACVIMEPMSLVYPEKGFLEEVKELTHKNGAILIFDEMITGFRIALGGAQERFGVVPDLACFGKAIANGYPLSAVCGKADIMREFEKTHFSFTNGGECLSLVAAKATVHKLRSLFINIELKGKQLIHSCKEKEIDIIGYPGRTQIQFDSDEKKWLFMQLCTERGILTMGVHNMMYAHSYEDINKLLSVYDEVFPLLETNTFEGEPPLSSFRIR